MPFLKSLNEIKSNPTKNSLFYIVRHKIKENGDIKAWLEFEPAYYDVAVQRVPYDSLLLFGKT